MLAFDDPDGRATLVQGNVGVVRTISRHRLWPNCSRGWADLNPAFTLVELLVVVAVVSLLIGMALPTLAGARASARTVKCLAQLRTLGQFAALYADTNRDLMPRSQHSAHPHRVMPWGYAFYEYVTGVRFTQADDGWDSVFNGPYRCPFDRRRDRWSYGYNVYFELAPDETGGAVWNRLGLTPRPHATVLFAELHPTAGADHAMAHFWTQMGAPPEIDATRHGTTTGVVFLDGHVESPQFESVFKLDPLLDCFNPATARSPS